MESVLSFRSILKFLWLVPLFLFSGCSLTESIVGFPTIRASQLPPELMAEQRSDMQEISMTRLRQDQPPDYLLDSGDVLGVFIENVLGAPDEAPPVHYHEKSNLPPAIGYPIPIREDGTLALPLVKPIPVKGLTIPEATEAIRNAFTVDRQILPEGKDRILITLIKRREYRVLVVREESGGQDGVTKRGTGKNVDLPAYENDLLHALNETGGMPGLDAKSEILIFRGTFKDAEQRDQRRASRPTDDYDYYVNNDFDDDPNVTKIALRYHPEDVPEFKPEDIILSPGDIVVIRSRDREKFYTGGLLRGGEHLVPRDYDLDVLAAIALSGGSIGSGGLISGGGSSGGSGGIGGGFGQGSNMGVPPSRVIILRSVPGSKDQVAIRVNLNRALRDRRERILIQPEDVILVQYTFAEEILNQALGLVRFNFLLNGVSGRGF